MKPIVSGNIVEDKELHSRLRIEFNDLLRKMLKFGVREANGDYIIYEEPPFKRATYNSHFISLYLCFMGKKYSTIVWLFDEIHYDILEDKDERI